MINWIQVFLDSRRFNKNLVLDPKDFEIQREAPKPPKSRYISESGKVVKGPGFID